MSLIGSIVSKILHPFGASEAKAAEAGTSSSTPSGSQAQPSSGGSAPASTPAGGGTASGGSVDVEAVLNDLAAKNPQKLNWRTSIVDLMKLLDLDSSLHARQQLADELHYTGDKNDSASMNIWLHKQVIKKLEENGGKVPADLKD
ncbi:DUF3597 domain-containing protein [Methylorubrum rhodesianum]|jgi:hypothetical protein|uniref:DUF3597 domain-containing protein n=1 Tax=Methylorubrum rhodesianum TaxID=29427 RepID=A0ABU9ZGG7_9HYPH|nr:MULTISPECIES: DUF3597 domain-containing protein [Methylorubrum]MBY0139799.1 DUF3597 domain-containing protein [Methylorubrum populi]MRI57240.1 DUF3597 domain-containing protein [Methylobacterium sp. DB1607]MBB5764477.1 hypothetical protein [Methylorubrum rhodesianum]MBI1689681.1 DUF3597 domain-containing protein [Methylorubrum sp. DB1722]MBK3402785.1 DUF3597 domain-containing protein [Methylorubrum rhodesianum]